MSLVLKSLVDPRDILTKASRYELCAFAQANGVIEIDYGSDMTLEEMIAILRNRGLTNITLPERPLGVYKPVVLGLNQQIAEKPAPAAPAVPEKPLNKMDMNELRAACKARGIKMERTDNMRSLREKLGQNAA